MIRSAIVSVVAGRMQSLYSSDFERNETFVAT